VYYAFVCCAQPPPPGAGEIHLFDPQRAPPPPPSIKSAALSIFKREKLFSFTEAICSGEAGEGKVHREICTKFLDEIGKFQFIYAVGTIAPLCSHVCWHSCNGDHTSSGQDHDDFTNCPQPECAQSLCYDFLIRECDPIQHAAITTKYKTHCTVAPPSPPAPPSAPPNSIPPPPPPPLPRAPPPTVQYFERLRNAERDSDSDCALVEYAECAEIVRQFAVNNPGHSDKLRVTTQHCEDTETESDCFVGCAFGDRAGATYRFLLPEVDDRFTKPRCKLSIHPRCACRNKPTDSPFFLIPPPPPRTYTEEWNIVRPPMLQADGTTERDTLRGAIGAMAQRLVNGRTLDLSLRSGPMHEFKCPLEDDGRDTCALTCASEHLGRLRAFTVTGENLKSSPPPLSPPQPPPAPPPPFVAGDDDRFNACQDSCTAVANGELFCRDGGHGSFTPALCPYSTQCSKCGPRTEVRSTTTVFEGDDTCSYANDNICQDGRPSTEESYSSFVVISEGVWAHLCGFLTDR